MYWSFKPKYHFLKFFKSLKKAEASVLFTTRQIAKTEYPVKSINKGEGI